MCCAKVFIRFNKDLLMKNFNSQPQSEVGGTKLEQSSENTPGSGKASHHSEGGWDLPDDIIPSGNSAWDVLKQRENSSGE
ncbi:hypothetical protein HG66A1_42850 [Gimesia chilikensis]|uniref:Uncharacterized protein n=2 Tax=Gimesia chilikensis TaxID=2605989 RepID=A0A517PSX5_9PLAN|nr:hypothetical protein HG66A1_42850 [Gimesia chilikensis]